MRVALVSDVHGNAVGFDAVLNDLDKESFDVIVSLGDVAQGGPQPAEVVDRIRELGWPGVVGNTDELLWRPEEHERQRDGAPRLAPLLELLFSAYAPDTRARIGDERLRWLRSLPAEYREGELAVVHAAPGDLWRAPLPDASDDELASTYAPLGSARAAYGHIHRPFARTVGDMTVANAGSVGLPFDGDPRAAYVLFEDGVARTVHVEYDVEREVAALRESGHPDAGRLAEMRRTGRFVRPTGR
jgi:predicted phosphodiesterase